MSVGIINEGIASKHRMASKIATGVVLIISIAVIFGWFLDIRFLKIIYPGFVSMKFNTALGFLFSSIAILIINPAIKSRQLKTLYFVCALIPFLIGTLTLAEYLLDVDLLIDTLFIEDNTYLVETYIPGRMSPNTAIGFVILSLVIFFNISTRWISSVIAQMGASVLVMLSVLPIMGYGYGESTLFGYSVYTRMALHTAFSFMLLNFGVLVSKPGEGALSILSYKTFGGKIARRLLPVLLALPLLAVWYRLMLGKYGLAEDPFYIYLGSIFLILFIVFLIWWLFQSIVSLSAEWQQMMQYIIKHDPNGIAVLDSKLRYLFASKRHLSDFNLSEREIMGKHHYEVFPDLPQHWMDAHQKALSGEIVNQDEDLYVAEDGAVHFTRWECRPWYKHDGTIGGIVVYSEVITDRKLMENEIKKSAFDLKTVLNNAGDGIISVDKDGIITLINKAALQMLGYNLEEVKGTQLSSILNNIAARSISRTLFARKDGNTFPVEYICTPIIEDGVTMGSVCSFRDVTQRKHSEDVRDVLYEISRYSVSTQNIENLLSVIITQLSRIMDVSNFIAALYNSEKEMLKKIVFVDKHDYFDEWPVENSLSGVVVKSNKAILLNKSEALTFADNHGIKLMGSPAECWMGVPITTDSQSLGVLVMQSYTTENAYSPNDVKIMEMVANQLAIVIQREEMIAKLIKEKERAQESDRLKSSFLSNMSHEIRTPMNGILGFLDLLKETEVLEDQRNNYINIITKSGNRLLSTINDIIEISRIESGQLSVSTGEVDIREVIKDQIDFFAIQAKEKGIELRVCDNLPDSISVINSDRQKIESILTNLIKNAIKFTSTGYVEVCCYEEGGLLIINVKDTGIGIAKENLDSVFKRFVQGDSNVSLLYEGSGLGLSIVKAYSEILGGNAWVESEPEKGSCFYFSIPIGN